MTVSFQNSTRLRHFYLQGALESPLYLLGYLLLLCLAFYLGFQDNRCTLLPPFLVVVVSELVVSFSYNVTVFLIKFHHITYTVCLFTGYESGARSTKWVRYYILLYGSHINSFCRQFNRVYS